MACSAACLLLVVLLAACVAARSEYRRQVSVRKDAKGQLEVVDGLADDPIATAQFNNTVNSTGWSFLKVWGHGGYDGVELARAAGMVEASITAELILMQWKNTLANFCSDNSTFCDKLASFIKQNLDYMNTMIEQNEGDPYWYQVKLFLAQLEGLMIGYAFAGLEPLDSNQLFLMQIGGDLESLQGALSEPGEVKDRVIGAGKCSALVKVLPGNAELYVSHDTWDDYQGMLRMYKLYDLKFSTSANVSAVVPGHRVSFSSYPGVLLSGDDFYQLSSKLVTTETTFGNMNPDLWKYVTPQSVLEGIRNVVANRLATTAGEWCLHFARYNSGTYNNQWMVVDYKQFERGQANLKDGLLWVLEQLPGTIDAADQTEMLRAKSYWPSFNIPYYQNIFDKSGFAEMEKKYGPWFSWDLSPRAQIYARNHTGVKDMASMIALMRYNNFQHDPLSRCNCTPPYSGENAISARSDLNPANGTYPFGALGHRSHGGTDNKVTSSQLMENGFNLGGVATSGPTHCQQPVFQWSTSGFPRPLGHPDRWDFQPVQLSWDT